MFKNKYQKRKNQVDYNVARVEFRGKTYRVRNRALIAVDPENLQDPGKDFAEQVEHVCLTHLYSTVPWLIQGLVYDVGRMAGKASKTFCDHIVDDLECSRSMSFTQDTFRNDPAVFEAAMYWVKDSPQHWAEVFEYNSTELDPSSDYYIDLIQMVMTALDRHNRGIHGANFTGVELVPSKPGDPAVIDIVKRLRDWIKNNP